MYIYAHYFTPHILISQKKNIYENDVVMLHLTFSFFIFILHMTRRLERKKNYFFENYKNSTYLNERKEIYKKKY